MKKDLKHIAFIPDGNRRWAKEAGLLQIEGHRRGYDNLKNVVQWCLDREIKEVSFWGFSTENWKRTKEEVGYLMDLFLRMLSKDLEEFSKKGFRLKVIGRRSDLSENLQKAIAHAEEFTKDNTAGQLNLCFNYGGRPEILEATKQCLREGLDPESLSEEEFAQRLWSSPISDIDLIVRTSGEQRLSGFQPWKGNYSELYFVQNHWPAFNEDDLDDAIDFYNGRDRRFGGNSTSLRT